MVGGGEQQNVTDLGKLMTVNVVRRGSAPMTTTPMLHHHVRSAGEGADERTRTTVARLAQLDSDEHTLTEANDNARSEEEEDVGSEPTDQHAR